MIFNLNMCIKDFVSLDSLFHLTDLSSRLNTLKAIINTQMKGNQMKILLVLMMAFTIDCIGAEEAKKIADKPTGPRFTHIQGIDGGILATIDNKDNSVDYIKDCEEVTPVLIQALQQTHSAYQNQITKIKAAIVKGTLDKTKAKKK